MIQEGRSLKKALCLTVAIIGVVIAVPSNSQTAGSAAAAAHVEPPELRVAVIVAPPAVMEQNGTLTGFSIDLWNAIATRLKLKTSYQIMPDVGALEEAMRSKRADLTLSVFITSARDEVFDFSIPTLQAGLQIMVRGTGETAQTANPLWDLLRLLLSPAILVWVGIALLLTLIPAHIMWLLDRRHEDGISHGEQYFPGILHTMVWAATALVSQVQELPKQWVARLLGLVWMFAGVVFVAFYTAQLTATLTVQQIRGAIDSPSDLPGKQVATLAGSTAVDYLREHKAQVQEFPTTDQMFQALLDKKVDAVVSGAPLLLYYAAHEGKGRVKVVGPEFNSAPIAIMLQLDSPLRKKVDRALIKLRENGTYQELYDKWFGSP